MKYSTELPEGFETWLQFYDSVRFKITDDEDRVTLQKYETPNFMREENDVPIVNHYKIPYVKQKAFDELMESRLPIRDVLMTFSIVDSALINIPPEYRDKVMDMKNSLIKTSIRIER